jgi:hypothetical protein
VEFQVPDEFIEAVAARAAEIARVSLNEARWLYGDKTAAEYLG